MTSFSSAGSFSTSASLSSSSSRCELRLELGGHPGELRVGARGVEVGARLTPGVREPLRRLELLQPAPRARGLAAVVVDRRVGHARLRLLVGAVQLVDKSLDRVHPDDRIGGVVRLSRRRSSLRAHDDRRVRSGTAADRHPAERPSAPTSALARRRGAQRLRRGCDPSRVRRRRLRGRGAPLSGHRAPERVPRSPRRRDPAPVYGRDLVPAHSRAGRGVAAARGLAHRGRGRPRRRRLRTRGGSGHLRDDRDPRGRRRHERRRRVHDPCHPADRARVRRARRDRCPRDRLPRDRRPLAAGAPARDAGRQRAHDGALAGRGHAPLHRVGDRPVLPDRREPGRDPPRLERGHSQRSAGSRRSAGS